MQNTSSAVMQQRKEPHDSLDDFPTQPWATRALLRDVIWPHINTQQTVWEPTANRGYMVRPLEEYFSKVIASDIHDYGYGYQVDDFLMPYVMNEVDWLFSNPPFRLAEQFIQKAIQQLSVGAFRKGAAFFVRSAFAEGVGRYNNIFSQNPPDIIAQFSERVPLFKGRVDPSGGTATAYCRIIWLAENIQNKETKFLWIPPCRKQLEKPGDYDLPEVK